MAKLTRAGADRVVNPQELGAARIAAFVLRPTSPSSSTSSCTTAARSSGLEEIQVAHDSPLAGLTVSQAKVRDRTGALLLAVRDGDGVFSTNPTAQTVMTAGHVLIAIGTEEQLHALSAAALGRSQATRDHP